MYNVYKLTFPNGKIYIGQTKLNPTQRWNNGNGYKGQEIYKAITKFGWDNVKKEILHQNLNATEANFLEQKYIKEYNSRDNGYNRNNGGGNKGNKEKNFYIDRQHAPKKNFICLSNELFFDAFNRLNKSGIGVFMYLCSQIPNTYNGEINTENTRRAPYELSPVAIHNATGMPITTARDGIQNLIDSGFAVLENKDWNIYTFYDVLPENKSLSVEENERVEHYNFNNHLEEMKKRREEQLYNIAINREKNGKYEWED